jgi:hypothetical protein
MKSQTIEELIEETVLDAIKKNPSFPRIASENRYLSIILKEDYLKNLQDYFSSPKEITFKNVIAFDPTGFIDNLIYGEYIIPEKIIYTLIEQKKSSSKIQNKPKTSKGTILKSLLNKAIGELLFQHNVLQRNLLKRRLITNSNDSYQCMIKNIIAIKQNKATLEETLDKIRLLTNGADKKLNNYILAYSKQAASLISKASTNFFDKVLKIYSPYFEIIDKMNVNSETAEEIMLVYNLIARKDCNMKRYKQALHEFGVHSTCQKISYLEAQLLRKLNKKGTNLLKIAKEYDETKIQDDLYFVLHSIFHTPKKEIKNYEQDYNDLKPPYKQLDKLKKIITNKKATLYGLNRGEEAIAYIRSFVADYSNKRSLLCSVPKELKNSNLEIYKTESEKIKYSFLQELFERSLDFAKSASENNGQGASLKKAFLSLAEEIISMSPEPQIKWPRGPYAKYLVLEGVTELTGFKNLREIAIRDWNKYSKFKK